MRQVRWIRVAFISISLASIASLLSPASRTAYHQPERETARVVITSRSLPPLVAEYHGFIPDSPKPAENPPLSNSGGIRE